MKLTIRWSYGIKEHLPQFYNTEFLYSALEWIHRISQILIGRLVDRFVWIPLIGYMSIPVSRPAEKYNFKNNSLAFILKVQGTGSF
ncbi:hypothetical protein TWF569_006470 [Orbilia oligospora]|uniref:Uncharacterized protein n=1 Tax=Orbilia oligospora TaxID=2813651 RepID=A0A7C8JGL0_ORBOL|nr:hypothetical protein TWF706_003105 [Orbilia oligospora]KAF3107881.1 hypothetical protein TWF102_011371 [Orbilia oligospora]KAF3145920.1 hypothetical protein TWF569_006470 [Orbilia oligospora]